MTAGNWGGSAAGGGFDFQAATSALCMVHMACGTPVRWSASGDDIPMSVSVETGGAGDDIALTLADGRIVEIQAKRRLVVGSNLWGSLLSLCKRASEDANFEGVLAVGPTTSVAIRDKLARDVVRLGDGRSDDLSEEGTKLLKMLSNASISALACGRVRIQTVHVLEQDAANEQAALANLAHITSESARTWAALKAEGLRMIKLRGRQDVASIARLIPELKADLQGALAPTIMMEQLLHWTLETTDKFSIPAVTQLMSLDDDWIELKAYKMESHEARMDSMEQALSHYHKGTSERRGRGEGRKLDAEGLGYFVRHCVIVAGPGMGKSQLLRRIARLLARKGEPSLLIPLRQLAEKMHAGEGFLDSVLSIGLDSSPLAAESAKKIGVNNLTLLLDGLDEAADGQTEIAKAVTKLAVTYPRCRVVFTTRPIGYDASELSSWSHYELASIESSDAKGHVERLVEAGLDAGNANVKRATAAAVGHFDYRRRQTFSAKSPLMIAMLASLSLHGIVAAETREGLYEQLFSLIELM